MTGNDFDYAGGPRAAVLADTAEARALAEEAVVAIGGRVVATIGWGEAGRLGDLAPDVLLAEAAGVPEERLAAALPAVAALDLTCVVAFERDQLDPVAAYLFGPSIALLCAPSPAERVAALALLGRTGAGHVRDSARDAERLHRLNAEVARIAEMLARLAGQEEAPDRPTLVADHRRGYGAGPPQAAAPDPADIRRAIRARRMRDAFFAPGLFEDPAWDMLLDLFAAEMEGADVSVSSLCIAAAVAPTTALRWIGRMVETGLFARRPDIADRRRAFVTLTEVAREGMRGYCAALHQQGLAIA